MQRTSAFPTTPSGQLIVEASDIFQRSLTAIRFPDTPALDEGRAAIEVKVEDVVPDIKTARDAFCKVTLTNSEGEPLFEVESVLRVQFTFDVEGSFDEGDVQDAMSEVALRVAYPYHRAAVAHSVSQAGLPGFVIPLAPDTSWKASRH